MFFLFVTSVYGQGLTIGSSAILSLGSAIFTLNGDWDNSGTFNAENGTVVFNGSGDQSVTNANGETFLNLTVNKTSGNVILEDAVEVDGTLSVVSGDVDLNGNVIALGSNATLSESDDATVKGTSGYITTTRVLNAPNNVNVAGLGAVLTSTANLGSTEIKRGHVEQSCNGNNSILRYYDITSTNNTGLDATFQFNYDTSELNSLNEDNLRLFKTEDNGVTWYNYSGTLAAASNYITLLNVDSFSRWTLSLNSAPSLSNIEPTSLEFTEGDVTKNISGTIVLTDVDDLYIESATIQITGNYMAGEDELCFNNTGAISSVWNHSNGTITLSGTDSKANYQEALRAVKYKNVNDNPTSSIQNNTKLEAVRHLTVTPRTISFCINDGDVNSNVVTRDISIIAVNDNPYLILNTGATVNNSETIIIDNSMLQAYDDESNSLPIRYYIIDLPLHGVLPQTVFTQNDINNGNISYSHDGSNSTNDSFTFYIDDLEGGISQNYTFEININETAPAQPTSIAWTYAAGGIEIQWQDNSDNEDGFNLWRQRDSKPKLDLVNEYLLIATLPANTTSYIDSDVEEDAVYSYRITSFNDVGSSGVATGDDGGETTAFAPLTTPTELHATDNGNLTVTIAWKDNSANETNYLIERKSGLSWTEIYSADANTETYLDVNVEEGVTYHYRVKAVNQQTQSVYSNESSATCTVTDLEDWQNEIPTKFVLNQNYPNPFNPTTTIRYGLAESSNVRLVVYNLLGQEIAVLVDEFQSEGYHEVIFNANEINTGIYLYKIQAGNFTQIKKCILLK